ncbi:MAG: hypothetical protein ACREN5_04610, partial [Gemmatimonadales bacterium]
MSIEVIPRGALAVVIILAGGGGLDAQELQSRARAPLDSATQRQHDALRAVRDSLSMVRAAAGEMQRDLSSGSPDLVAGRAVRLAWRCQHAHRATRDA